ncbi:A24 family peptidase [Oceanobacillus rekensis]|uniref:A24 family peptidase n=1 Tax=Oceanobacillus rekensis TaxID=937927 RepID=UPI000B444587|nr:prepilin peptidase [Oceanobacillus rekensis]
MIDIFLIVILLICLITDIKNRMIYNKVIYPALLITFIYQFTTGGWEALSHSFIGFLIGFGLLLIPYFMGGMGAGDVKLLALIGAMKGGAFVFQSFIYIAIIGGLIAVLIILLRGNMLKSLAYYFSSIIGGNKVQGVITKGSLSATYPYGVAIVGGAFVGLLLQGMSLL